MPLGSKRSRRPKRATPSASSVPQITRLKLSKQWTWVILAVILTIAASLRFYGLEAAPPGLYIDEAADGANAVQAWRGGWLRRYWITAGMFTLGTACSAYPLVSYLLSHPGTASNRVNQVGKSNLRFYTPLTFPVPLSGGSPNGDFCSQVKAALPNTIVVCVAL